MKKIFIILIYLIVNQVTAQEEKCVQRVSGKLIEKNTKYIIPMMNMTLVDRDGNIVGKTQSDYFGKFTFKDVPCQLNFTVNTKHKEIGNNDIKITTQARRNSYNFINLSISDPLIIEERGVKMLNVKSLSFELNSSVMTIPVMKQLRKVIKIMYRYPEMVIALGVHSDSRGNDDDNLALTKTRAASILNYLIEKGGFSSDNITAEGYGEYQLLNDCDNLSFDECTSAEHAINRRMEFVIK